MDFNIDKENEFEIIKKYGQHGFDELYKTASEAIQSGGKVKINRGQIVLSTMDEIDEYFRQNHEG